MPKIGALFVCILIIALDVAAGICGIEAEVAENKAKHLRLWIFECKDPSHRAFKLGLAAAGLLALAHIIANVLGGCMGLCSQQKAYFHRQFTTACLFLAWSVLVPYLFMSTYMIIAAVGIFMLVIGIRSNDESRASCGFNQHHMLSIAGILCFVHSIFAVAFYVSAASGNI
ncbi:hypothetical protein Cgig2_006288 [Carnegiea gigantea]|uniref:Uncharacterized protein n=1 Tax=Carnegiea gigantea TaxID=171969 RepID=A0A9Q1K8K9_9CARY|nr:hypothetical protein Cgig2_006288 [Carnegiea gigantea]